MELVMVHLTYAIVCYLKLLLRLCYIFDTGGGVKRVKDGASQDQILNETRLQNLQCELVNGLHEVARRLIWALAKRIDLEGLDPLLADDPEDHLNLIISNVHKSLELASNRADSVNKHHSGLILQMTSKIRSDWQYTFEGASPTEEEVKVAAAERRRMRKQKIKRRKKNKEKEKEKMEEEEEAKGPATLSKPTADV
ncbi:hypothetical protein SAY86_009936 [Trapa natans]|uniref:Uncharacterized protein n=1 Tax=Trapa natans TaxID=22666 RepID=A0AAN7KXN4_TRANT|nr:hypothetical protein SAY86_009936 [Trapa natans]